MEGVQKALAGLPGAVFYGAALLLVTAAGACGFVAGSRAPGALFELYATQHPMHAVLLHDFMHVGKRIMTKLLPTHSALHLEDSDAC